MQPTATEMSLRMIQLDGLGFVDKDSRNPKQRHPGHSERNPLAGGWREESTIRYRE